MHNLPIFALNSLVINNNILSALLITCSDSALNRTRGLPDSPASESYTISHCFGKIISSFYLPTWNTSHIPIFPYYTPFASPFPTHFNYQCCFASSLSPLHSTGDMHVGVLLFLWPSSHNTCYSLSEFHQAACLRIGLLLSDGLRYNEKHCFPGKPYHTSSFFTNSFACGRSLLLRSLKRFRK